MNTSTEPVIHRNKRNSGAVHIIAPGQRRKLSNWLTEENHDINALSRSLNSSRHFCTQDGNDYDLIQSIQVPDNEHGKNALEK